MDTGVRELLDLILRWIHVIAAIMWIGNSLLFNWLDRNLLPPKDATRGAHGEIWLLHSGGFYQVEKTMLAGQELPRPLHWFKWQAYTTWISGALLLVVVYYLSAGALLVDPTSPLSPTAAVALGIGLLALAWVVYDLLWRSPLARSWLGASAVSFLLVMVVAFGLTQVFTGRAAFLHVGAMLGTLMAGNVAMKIMPAQRQLVAAVAEGKGPDPVLADQAKLRSIHNNYMTFPVIVLMLSSHFPSFYGHSLNWLLLGILLLAGAGVRHILNIRFAYPRWIPALAATTAVAVAALALVAFWPASRPAAGAPQNIAEDGPVPFAEVRTIVDRRCTVCHSANPADRTFGVAPGGVTFDTPEQIRARAERIRVRAVATKTMPPGNRTWMTPEEREILRRWLDQGARIR